MKKLLAVILVLVLVLSMSLVAFGTQQQVSTMDINKEFMLTNEGSVSPEEKFEFTITPDKESEFANPVPEFVPATYSIEFAKGVATLDGKTIIKELNLPNFTKVGIYTYKINELPGSTAGITYDQRILLLSIQVVNGNKGPEVGAIILEDEDSKVEGFKNEFSAGKLSISKDVTGNMGEKDRFFEVEVNLTAPQDKTVKDAVTVSGSSNVENPTTVTVGTEATFLIKDGDTIHLENIPYGVTYTVVETAPGNGYDEVGYEFSNKDKSMNSASETVKITNHKDEDILTGINLDNLPYVLVLGIATVGLFGFTMKKRFNK